MIAVSNHAVERYIERVAAVSHAKALAAMQTPTIRLAASIGAPFVKLGSGHVVVIEGGAVVTILPKDHNVAGLSMAWTHHAQNKRVGYWQEA
tara:strand:+ start:21695 stop:21970 length:276 start_codon:yes stop_codon:yes gene_type:complete